MKDRTAFWANVDKTRKCWVWTRAKTNGYGWLLWRGRTQFAHRVSWSLSVGPIPEGKCVLHKCDNPPCVNPAHLYIGTLADNMRDMWSRKRHPIYRPRGEASPNAKLTWDQVRTIREMDAQGHQRATLARKFNISKASITGICQNQSWKEIS